MEAALKISESNAVQRDHITVTEYPGSVDDQTLFNPGQENYEQDTIT